jgi:hypothetical protein
MIDLKELADQFLDITDEIKQRVDLIEVRLELIESALNEMWGEDDDWKEFRWGVRLP